MNELMTTVRYTGMQINTCPACGGMSHDGGVGACWNVLEVEYFEDGRLRRFKKREDQWFPPANINNTNNESETLP